MVKHERRPDRHREPDDVDLVGALLGEPVGSGQQQREADHDQEGGGRTGEDLADLIPFRGQHEGDDDRQQEDLDEEESRDAERDGGKASFGEEEVDHSGDQRRDDELVLGRVRRRRPEDRCGCPQQPDEPQSIREPSGGREQEDHHADQIPGDRAQAERGEVAGTHRRPGPGRDPLEETQVGRVLGGVGLMPLEVRDRTVDHLGVEHDVADAAVGTEHGGQHGHHEPDSEGEADEQQDRPRRVGAPCAATSVVRGRRSSRRPNSCHGHRRIMCR